MSVQALAGTPRAIPEATVKTGRYQTQHEEHAMTHTNRISRARRALQVASLFLAAAPVAFAAQPSAPLMGQMVVSARALPTIADLGSMTVTATPFVTYVSLGEMTVTAQRDVLVADLGAMTVNAQRELLVARTGGVASNRNAF
ncbi:MAG TPA: hypothetical protein VFR59_01970 [Steroidobacteraceae bacterium]|nr:hypothetical protein [Steroidobacteraceae bacterium]